MHSGHPTSLDNRGASSLSYNPDSHKHTKHIRRQPHFVWESVEDKDITVHLVPGEANLADLLTKPVTGPRLSALKTLAGMTTSRVDRIGSLGRNHTLDELAMDIGYGYGFPMVIS